MLLVQCKENIKSLFPDFPDCQERATYRILSTPSAPVPFKVFIF